MSNSPSQRYHTIATHVDAPHTVPSRPRTRTMSLMSVSSNASFRSLFDITKAQSTAAVSQRHEKHEAYGAFIPVRSATTCLKDFASQACHPSATPRSPPKLRRVTFDNRTYSRPREQNDASSPQIAHTGRTFASSQLCPPSPTSSSSSIMTSHDAPADLHPILAKLEKKSKLCAQLVYCSTCRKAGRDFPRCGKCGEMWCSRSCRLVGGKRHVCST